MALRLGRPICGRPNRWAGIFRFEFETLSSFARLEGNRKGAACYSSSKASELLLLLQSAHIHFVLVAVVRFIVVLAPIVSLGELAWRYLDCLALLVAIVDSDQLVWLGRGFV